MVDERRENQTDGVSDGTEAPADGETAEAVTVRSDGEAEETAAAKSAADIAAPSNGDEGENSAAEEDAPLGDSNPLKTTYSGGNKKKRALKITLTVLFVAAMAAIIAFTAVQDFTGESVSFSSVSEMIGANWYYLFVLFGLFAGTVLCETLKIFLMIRKTTKTYKLGTAFNCAALGKYYDYVTPLGSGGQPFQIYYLAKHGVPSGPAGAIPIGSFFLTQFAFFICAVVSFGFGVSDAIVPLYIQIAAYVGAVFYIIVPLSLLVFSFLPKVGYKLIGFGVKVLTKIRICKNPDGWNEKGRKAIDNNKKNMAILFKSKRVLIVCSLLSIVYVILQCSMPYFTLMLFGGALAEKNMAPSWDLWFEITRITFFIYCAITFIPTPGNSGAADGTFYGLFRSVLISVAGACFTGMMIWRIFSFYAYIILGLVVSIAIKIADTVRKKKKKRLLPL